MKSKLTVESSLLNDPNFIKDYETICDEYEKMFLDPQTELLFEQVKQIYKFYYSKQPDEVNFLAKMFLSDPIKYKAELEVIRKYIINNLPMYLSSKQVQLRIGENVSISIATKFKPTTQSAFYTRPSRIGIIIPSIPTNVTVKDFYNRRKKSIKSSIIHELSHHYKFQYRKSFRKKKIKDFEVGGIDYAAYDDERESYLAEIWKEMEEAYQSGKKTFEECLYSSETFLNVLESAGLSDQPGKIDKKVFSKLSKKRQQTYKYFLKKLIEKWINSGYGTSSGTGSITNIEKDNNKKFSLFKRLISKLL